MVIEIDCEVSGALFMYLPAFPGFGAALLPVLYLLSEDKIFLQFCMICLEGILLVFSSNKGRACVFRGHC